MKYICFGYLDVESWGKHSPGEQNAMIDQCFAYDEVLKKNGHWAGGEGLQGATTLSYRNGQVSISDGPYAETKELLGGLLMLEARDLNRPSSSFRTTPASGWAAGKSGRRRT